MTEHKFTDEEVIKALECCWGGDETLLSCKGCPLREYKGEDLCMNALYGVSLDLIKRQKAETAYWMDEAANAKKEAVKEFAERLKEKPVANGIYPVLVKNSMDKLLKEMTVEEE